MSYAGALAQFEDFFEDVVGTGDEEGVVVETWAYGAAGDDGGAGDDAAPPRPTRPTRRRRLPAGGGWSPAAAPATPATPGGDALGDGAWCGWATVRIGGQTDVRVVEAPFGRAGNVSVADWSRCVSVLLLQALSYY